MKKKNINNIVRANIINKQIFIWRFKFNCKYLCCKLIYIKFISNLKFYKKDYIISKKINRYCL